MRKEESKAWLVRPWENRSETRARYPASSPCVTGEGGARGQEAEDTQDTVGSCIK